MDFFKVVDNRHSMRKYLEKQIEKGKLSKCEGAITTTLSIFRPLSSA